MGMVSTTVEPRATGTRVLIHDQRYGMLSDPLKTAFRAEADFDAEGRLLSVRHPLDYMRGDFGGEFALLWKMIFG